MHQTLAHRTIVIVEGRSLSSFVLRKALEDDGAAVCVASRREALVTLRNARPDAVVIDFSLAAECDDLCGDMDGAAIPHMYCSSPNRQQDANSQVLAAQDVAIALAEHLGHRNFTPPLPLGIGREIDPELYAI